MQTWTQEPGGLQSMQSQRVGHDWATNTYLYIYVYGEGNGNPLQYSCLEDFVDRRAWWAAVHWVAQNWTQLKRLSMHAYLCSIHGLGGSAGGKHFNPLQYSCLENPHGQRSLAGCSSWSCKELDMTERLSTATQHMTIISFNSFTRNKFTSAHCNTHPHLIPTLF